MRLKTDFVKTYELFVNANVHFFCQQHRYTAVTNLRLQVLDTATVIQARDCLLAQKTQVSAVIMRASPIKYWHIPSSL